MLGRALRLAALLAVAGLLAVLVWRTVRSSEGAELVSAIEAGKRPRAPAFELPVLWSHDETWPPAVRDALADGKVSGAELRGHPVVLNFWASWCIPCKKEAPRLTASAWAHRRRVVFLGVDVQDFKSDARRFLVRYATNYVSVRDGGSATYERYGLTGVPETYYLDARGRIVAHSVGEVSRRELEQGVTLAMMRRRAPQAEA